MSVVSLKTMKDKLGIIQSVQGASLDELEHQLQESRNIYSKMSQNLQGEILQNLISVILACDQDGDMVLSDEEIDDIILKLEGIHNLDLDEDMIRAKIQDCGRSLNGMYAPEIDMVVPFWGVISILTHFFFYLIL